MRHVLAGGAALALVLLSAGCDVEPFCLYCADGDVGDAGPDTDLDAGGRDVVAPDAGPPDAGLPDGCTPGAPELCNAFDDDCDRMVDEGIDTDTDLAHCGGCGMACAPPHAFAMCTGGVCGIDGCDVGWHDVDGDPATGCEYRCLVSETDDSLCDLRDNDCDGSIDEDVDFDNDMINCGSCGRICSFAHASASCMMGACVIGSCDAGYYDIDGAMTNGCEYGCMPSTPPTETCNLRDDDCNGMVDEGDPGGGASCGTNTGECVAGTMRCTGGSVRCTGETGPSLDVCNGLDDDCDGTPDQSFDLTTDVTNCGMCGRTCSFPNALASCASGACVLTACMTGFFDADGSPANGCEYMCSFAGSEVCNGRDDDCDRTTDEGLTPPASFCNPNGVCAGSTATCGGASGWTCSYPPTYEMDETTCDGADNDCDGRVDEAFPLVGTACNNGELGLCRRTGMYVCNAAGDAAVCNAPASGASMPETCNGVDDDCDGALDEASPTTWVPFSGSFGSRWIFAYEASRPDSTSAAQGSMTHRACSLPSRQPWTNVTYAQAQAACATVGGRLCTEAEWERACEASSGSCTWSYGSSCTTYAGSTCNGNDYDTSGAAGDQDAVLATGSLPMCYANWGSTANRVYDMSGNVEEWAQRRSVGVNPLRGGSTNDTSGGIRCSFDFPVASDTFQIPTVGFRCCRSTAPP